MSSPKLSIVIPAYNEAGRLPASLERIVAYLETRDQDDEVIVVDDGSSDETVAVAEKILGPIGARGRVIRNPVNMGKGASVRRGMLGARGARVLFSDADLSAPIEELPKLERALDEGAGIAIGSRLDRTLIEERQSLARSLMGRLFNLVVQLFAVRGIHDTQCGFKLFVAEVVGPIFARARIERFGFDVEVLALAQRLGVPIAEVPVRWRNSPGSTVTLAQGARAFLDPVKVRLGMVLGRYQLRRATRWTAARVPASGR